MSRTHDGLAAILLLTVCVGAWILTADLPVDAKMFPRLIIGFLGGLSALWLGRTLLQPHPAATAEPFFKSPGVFLVSVLGILLYVFAVSQIGYFTATVAFIPVMAVLLGYRRPVGIAVGTVVFCALIYGVFVLLFDRRLPAEFFLRWTY